MIKTADIPARPLRRPPFWTHLYVQVLAAILAGAAIGHFWPDLGAALKSLGDAFIKLVKMIIAPVIFLTVTTGIAGMPNLSKVGGVATKAFAYFISVSSLALVVGLVVANLVQPGLGMKVDAASLDPAAVADYAAKSHEMTVTGFLMDIIPETVAGAFVSGSILQVLFFAIPFGVALSLAGESGKPLLDVLNAAAAAFFKLVAIFMRTAPIGAFGAFAFTVGKYGIESIVSLAALVATFYATSLLFVLLVLGAIARLNGFSILKLIGYLKEELLLVLGTSSSEAALPSLLEKLERAGAPKTVVGLVVPTGYSFNLDGTNLYMTLAALFIAQALRIELSLTEQLLLLGVAMLSSKGAAGVTGAGFITLAATLSVVPSVPVAGMALILGVDRFMSECRALTNFIGNAVATLVVSRWEGVLDRDALSAALDRGPGPIAAPPVEPTPIEAAPIIPGEDPMKTPKLDRRHLLGLGVTAAVAANGAAGAASRRAPKAPAVVKGLPDVVVAGAGAFGGWAALELRERGYKVTLVDPYGPGNALGSSGGETRNIRAGYGDRGLYSAWAARAWIAWHERQEEFARKLIYPSGSLRDPGPQQMAAQVAVYDRLKLPYEMLSADEVRRRWPQIRTDDVEQMFFDIQSGGVKARESSIAVAEAFERKGGEIRLGRAAPGDGAKGRLNTVLIDGEPLAAGEFVFACGPWLPKLFPAILGDKIHAPRAELFFVGPAPGDYRYRWENVPSISDQITYTTADIGGGYKVAARLDGVLLDPDDGERMPTPFLMKQVEAYVQLRLPGLVGRPIIQTYVGQTDHTSTGHYIFDRHPDYGNLLIAGGGSGHAFKMGPVLGAYVADRIAGLPEDPALRAVFSLESHGPVGGPRRAHG